MLVPVSAAFAADPTFATPTAPGGAEGPPKMTLAAELGGVWTSGNAVSYAVNGALKGQYRWRKNVAALQLGANLGRGLADADGDGRLSDTEREAPWAETARRYAAEARYDRLVGKRDGVYLLAGAAVDPFAGYDTRTHAQTGWSHLFTDTKAWALRGELGADVAREDYVDGVEPNRDWVYAARAMVGGRYAFSDEVGVEATVEVYESVVAWEDVRVLSNGALVARLDGAFSLRLSHVLAFDNQPVEDYRETDQTTMVTLVAAIL
ncbi:MAG: DUF481 domain-containing protein [Myxococcota bacterium]